MEKLAACWALCGVVCWVLLLFWGVYVFLPYVLWALRQPEKRDWNGFYDPPEEFYHCKIVKRLLAWNKAGWIIVAIIMLSILFAELPLRVIPIALGIWFFIGVLCCSLVVFIASPGECLSEIKTTWKKIQEIKHFSYRQKIFLGLSLVSESLLIAAMCDRFTAGFYVFLRIVVCSAFIGKILERFPAWCNLFFILAVILYNPLLPIHLGDRKVWMFFNAVAILVLIAAEIATIHKFLKRSNS